MATKFKDVFTEYHAEAKRWGDLAAEQNKIVKEQHILLAGHQVERRTHEARIATEAIAAAEAERDRLLAGWRLERDNKWLPILKEAREGFEDGHRRVIDQTDLKIHGLLNDLYGAVEFREKISCELSDYVGQLARLENPHPGAGGYTGLPNALAWGFVPQSADAGQRVNLNFSEIIRHFLVKRGATFQDYLRK